MTGQALIVQADALRLPLPDASVDLCVTSPPYAFLRAYDTGYPDLEVGAEATPAEFLEHLWQATAEMVRVLKPTGSIFVDLGDKYDSSSHATPGGNGAIHSPRPGRFERQPIMGRPKSLMLLPERYRIGAVDQLGLIARAVIVWDKPNGLPESVTDRVRRSHEDWVHLTRQPRYYSAIDEVREPHAREYTARDYETFVERANRRPGTQGFTGGNGYLGANAGPNPLGKLPGSVWTIPSEPLRLPDHLGVQHYAAFPSEWPRRLILGWSPPGICLDCEQGRVPVVERGDYERAGITGNYSYGPTPYVADGYEDGVKHGHGASSLRMSRTATILGYACACTPHTDHPGSGERQTRDYQPMPDARPQGTYGRKQAGEYQPVGPWREYHLDGWKPPPTRPAVVLDAFGGTGTVAMVARALDRIGISLDLSFPYCRAARWRIHHDAAKAISRTWTERQGSLL